MLRSAGCSSGRSVCARGGLAVGQCGSIAAIGVRFTPDAAFLLECLALGSRLLFDASAKQDGLRNAPFLFRAGRDRLSAFSKDVRLSRFVGSLRNSRFLAGDLDGVRPEFAYAKRSAALGMRFFRYGLLIRYDTAGSTLGLKCGSRTAAAPDCAKEPLALWTLFLGFAAKYLLPKPRNNCYL